jgi:hypothetical protein
LTHLSTIRTFALVALVPALGACASADPNLFAPGDPPQLLDGEVRMTTDWAAGGRGQPDLRLITCRAGRVTCSLDSARGRMEGEASPDDWIRLWSRLEPVAPWSATSRTVQPDDPTGGPYHLVQMAVGGRVSSFSSQQRADLLIFTSRDVAERISFTNVIVDFVATHATNPIRKGPETPPPGESAPGSGPAKEP